MPNIVIWKVGFYVVKWAILKKKIKNQSYKGVDSQAGLVQNQLLSLFQFFLGINASV